MTALGLVLLAGLVGGCVALLRRLFREDSAVLVFAAAPALALACLAVGANLLAPWLQPGWGGAVVALLGAAAWRLRGGPPLRPPKGAELWLAAAGAVLVGLYTWDVQWQHAAHDFWIDFAQQGLMLRGEVPPGHPFFGDLEMAGHYGRNLLVATVAQMLAADLATAGVVLTTLCQVLTFVLLFSWLVEEVGSVAAGLFGSGLAFLGLAVGGWAGLLDHHFHHASLAWLLLVLAAYLSMRVLELDFPVGPTLVAALVMAALALTFEIYFGLLMLVVPIVAVLRRGWRRLPLFLAACGVLAVLQGGVLGDLALRALGATEPPSSTALLNQSQRVVIDFPKSELFKIRLEPWHYWRVSCARATPTVFGRLPDHASGRFYAYLWSPDVLRLHWLPLFLSPLAAVVLLRRREPVGLLWLCFGALAFLIPGVVDFGPIYESEYYRWELAAGLGFGLALGVAMGLWWDESPTQSRGVLLGLVAVSSSVAGLHRLDTTLRDGVVCRFPSNSAYLLEHRGQLGLDPVDLEVCSWLRENASAGQRMVVNYSLGHPFGLTSESTLVGLTGVRSVGHAFPTASDFVGTPPFRPSALARVFWHEPRAETLAALDVDWLYVRVTEDRALDELPGLELVLEREDSEGNRRRLYRVLTSSLRLDPPSGRLDVRLVGSRILKLEKARVVDLGLSALPPEASLVHYRFRPLDPGGFDVEPDPVTFPLEPSLPLAVPVESGRYELELSVSREDGTHHLSVDPVECEVTASWGRPVEPPAGASRLSLEVVSLQAPDVLAPASIATARLQLRNTSGRPLSAPGLKLSIVPFHLGTGQYAEEVASHHVQRDLRVAGGDEVALELPLVTPARAGRYRMDLQLTPREGGAGTRLVGPERVVLGPAWNRFSPSGSRVEGGR